MMRFSSVIIAALAAVLSRCHAFSLATHRHVILQHRATATVVAPSLLFMSSNSEMNDSDEPLMPTNAVDETNTDTMPNDNVDTTAAADLELLKQEIAALEENVKQTRHRVRATADQADDYTKSGYARKVAEMENMRRARSMLNTSSRSSAKAVVLKEFIPILDTLQELRAKYGADDFGKQFDALYGTMKTAFASMGVNEFHAQVGDVVDMARMNVVEQVYSSAVPKGAVVDVVSNNHCGMELDGNCMRMVKVVASLGPEPATAVAAKDDGEEMPEEATEM